ncbi:MAG: dihydroneopterin aldolase [Actinomycetia bacterium]|nr:dihydroneopterin aldolase [Actinomycetes bacterium]
MALSPTARLTLTGLRARGFHGVLPEERALGQIFVVDVIADVDAPDHDDLAATLDYAALARRIVDHVGGEPCQLIETLAARIADDLVTTDRVHRITVRVHKPDAPLGVDFTDVSVELTRTAPAAPPPIERQR